MKNIEWKEKRKATNIWHYYTYKIMKEKRKQLNPLEQLCI